MDGVKKFKSVFYRLTQKGQGLKDGHGDDGMAKVKKKHVFEKESATIRRELANKREGREIIFTAKSYENYLMKKDDEERKRLFAEKNAE